MSARGAAAGPSGVSLEKRRGGIVGEESLDEVRSALGVDEHLSGIGFLDRREVGKDPVVLVRGDIRHERAAARRNEEVEVPDRSGQLGVRERGDGRQFVHVVRADGRLHDEGEAGLAEDSGAGDGVPPRPGDAPEPVVPFGIQRVQRKRQAPDAFFEEKGREGRRDLDPVGPDHHEEPPGARVADDLQDVAAQQWFAAGQDRNGLGGERRDVVDDLEALGCRQLAPVGEGLVLDKRLAARVQVAVLAGEVTSVGQIPGDDVGAGEGRMGVHRAFTSRSATWPRRGPRG